MKNLWWTLGPPGLEISKEVNSGAFGNHKKSVFLIPKSSSVVLVFLTSKCLSSVFTAISTYISMQRRHPDVVAPTFQPAARQLPAPKVMYAALAVRGKEVPPVFWHDGYGIVHFFDKSKSKKVIKGSVSSDFLHNSCFPFMGLWLKCLKVQSNEIFDPQVFSIIQTGLGHWPMG